MPKANLLQGTSFMKKHKDHETFEHFVTDLKLLVKDCGCAKGDKIVRNCLVFAANSPKVREKQLNQSADLTLEKRLIWHGRTKLRKTSSGR